MNKDSNEFSIEVSSDLDYEKMVVNINFKSNHIAILSCENGLDKAKIEILDRFEDKKIWRFSFIDFVKILNLAYEKLEESNKNFL